MKIDRKFAGVSGALLLLCVVAVGAYLLVFEKMAASGYGSFAHFYWDNIVAELQQFKFHWELIAVALSVSFFALFFEAGVLGWSKSSLRRLVRLEDKSTVNDVFYWIVGAFRLGAMMRIALTLGVAAILSYALRQLNFDIRLIDKIDTPFIQYLVAFLIMDFLGYFQHRLAHSWGWWWELHKIHHSAEKFNMVTYYRTHVLESVPRAVIYGFALSITGDLNSFIFYYILLEFISLLVHSEIQYKWGWLEKYLLVSPRNHKIHHSTDPEHHDKNFGFTLIVWDRIFGTWHEPRDGEVINIGLKANPFNHSNPISDLIRAYGNSLRSLVGFFMGNAAPIANGEQKPEIASEANSK